MKRRTKKWGMCSLFILGLGSWQRGFSFDSHGTEMVIHRTKINPKGVDKDQTRWSIILIKKMPTIGSRLKCHTFLTNLFIPLSLSTISFNSIRSLLMSTICGVTKFKVIWSHVEMQKRNSQGRSPGLVVMADNSSSRGHGFESWRRILDGHFCINLL